MGVRENEIGYEVLDGSIHLLPSCPCVECVRERERRASAQRREPAKRSVISMSVEAATLFGFVDHRSPRGSLARSLLPE